jgi:hypothetical protein
MLVLILAVASFLLFLGIVVLLWLADVLESREIRRKRTLSLQKPLALLSITQAYDPTYALLWEAPIAALELIESGGESGIAVARLRPFFNKASACFPEIYEGCSFVQWLRFLEETELISWVGYKVLLTAEGKAFLKYRFVTDALVEA